MYQFFELALRKSAVALAFAFCVLAAVSPALAKEKKNMHDGNTACNAFCDANNKTTASQQKCRRKCELYWGCNGSDSTEQTCSDVKNATAELPKPPSTVSPPKAQKGVANTNATGGFARPKP